MDILDQVDKVLQLLSPTGPLAVAEHKDELGFDTPGRELSTYRAPVNLIDSSLSDKNNDYLFTSKFQKYLSSPSNIKQPQTVDIDDWTAGFIESRGLNNEPLRQEIFAAQTHSEIIQILSRNSLEHYVSAYQYYLDERERNLDENENPNIIFQSLQSWAWFIADYTNLRALPLAEISADFDGCLEMEWRLSSDEIPHDPYNEFYGNGRGIAVLTFYPASLNHLSILSGAYASGKPRITLDCFLPHEMTTQIIDLFTERLLHPDADLRTQGPN